MKLTDLFDTVSPTIMVDGVIRPAYNSKGNPIAKSENGLFNFWRWFGDSKVVDHQGRSLVVYHGTSDDFDYFDNKKTGRYDGGLWGKGHYFSASIDGPNSYALRQGDGARIMVTYVSIKNPMVLRTNKDLITRLPDGRNYR